LIRKDKFALLLVFALPIMIMGTMYIAINQASIAQINQDTGKNVDALVIGVVDIDPTDTFPGEDLSANFTWYLTQSPEFIVFVYEHEEDARNALYQDVVKAFVVIPYGFEGNITGDIPAFVDLHVSSSDLNTQMDIFGSFSGVVNDFRFDHGWIKGEIATIRIGEFEPEGTDSSATIFGVFMLVFSVFIAVSATAAQAIVGDVPLSRMLLTPSTKMEAILSKTLAYFFIGMVQAVVLLFLWMWMFAIVPNTSPLIILFILGLMSISGSALGVLISTLVTTRLQANQSFLFLLFGSLIVGTGLVDVGIVDEVFPLNLGRVMIVDTAFKGILITEFLNEIFIILAMTVAFVLLAWGIFVKKTTLA